MICPPRSPSATAAAGPGAPRGSRSKLWRDAPAVAILAVLVLGVFAVTWQRTSTRAWGLPTR